MKYLLLALSLFIAFSSVSAQSVVVTGKKVTYTRPKPISEYKASFWINHPKVKAATPALSKKIEKAISFEKVMPLNIREETNDIQWLDEADFEVNYNKNGLLGVTLSIAGSAAYPDGSSKRVVVDTRTGVRLRAADLFRNVAGLAAKVKRLQRREIDAAIAEIKKDPEAADTNPADLFENADFKAANLNEFMVTDKGVTFYYDYGFPHVIQALQPDGEFSLTWAELKPFLKPGGLLSRIAR